MDARLFFFTIFLFLPVTCSVYEPSVLREGEAISPSRERTIISSNNGFKLGFFDPLSGGDRWYLGIWYNIPVETYVWVANRDNPLGDYEGTLSIVGGNLVIRDAHNSIILWSTKLAEESESSPGNVVAELLDTGNLVVRYSDSDDFLWQSFDYPTDTLIRGMKLGVDTSNPRTAALKRTLISWRYDYDPSSGNFTLTSRNQGSPELDITGASGEYRSTWDGEKFVGLPRVFNVTWDSQEATACLYVGTNNFSRLRMDYSGLLVQYEWNQYMGEWVSSWYSANRSCSETCTINGYCDMNVPPKCNCIKGFEKDPSDECMRKPPLKCGANKFYILGNMHWTRDWNYNERENTNKERCRQMCIENCQCTAFIVTNGSTCNILIGNLFRLQPDSDSDQGVDVHIKLNGKKKKNDGVIIGLAVGIPVALVALALYFYCKRKRSRARQAMGVRRRDTGTHGAELMSDPRLPPPMDFGEILQATANFSNEIGHGGFGKVYKGRLRDGQEIAAKRLSEMSSQGIVEFRTEIQLIASLQHINLVRLIGWAVHEEEMVLVYEYLENGSLESHLFGGGQSSSALNWQTRYQVIKGIARGLTYLHHDSRVRTVHRDLKPANVLLNTDFVPKISDFGLARIYEMNDNDGRMTHPAGTRPYMSPEYIMNGRYSLQSDTFSFGVMVLEIVSGKKNATFSHSRSDTNLLSFAWTNWEEGNWQESVDEAIRDSSRSQVLRTSEIGLLCVQQLAEDRPLMHAVMSLFENDTLEVPKPKPPGFFMYGGQSYYDTPPSSSKSHGEGSTSSASINLITITEITPQ